MNKDKSMFENPFRINLDKYKLETMEDTTINKPTVCSLNSTKEEKELCKTIDNLGLKDEEKVEEIVNTFSDKIDIQKSKQIRNDFKDNNKEINNFGVNEIKKERVESTFEDLKENLAKTDLLLMKKKLKKEFDFDILNKKIKEINQIIDYNQEINNKKNKNKYQIDKGYVKNNYDINCNYKKKYYKYKNKYLNLKRKIKIYRNLYE